MQKSFIDLIYSICGVKKPFYYLSYIFNAQHYPDSSYLIPHIILLLKAFQDATSKIQPLPTEFLSVYWALSI